MNCDFDCPVCLSMVGNKVTASNNKGVSMAEYSCPKTTYGHVWHLDGYFKKEKCLNCAIWHNPKDQGIQQAITEGHKEAQTESLAKRKRGRPRKNED